MAFLMCPPCAPLGVVEDVLVGVTTPAEKWYVPEVKKGMAAGKIAFLGKSGSLDFERLRQQRPELVLTWDPGIIPMLDELGDPLRGHLNTRCHVPERPHAPRSVPGALFSP